MKTILEQCTIYDEVDDKGVLADYIDNNHQYFDRLMAGSLRNVISVYKLGKTIGFSYKDFKNNKVYWYHEETDLTDPKAISKLLRERAEELFNELDL